MGGIVNIGSIAGLIGLPGSPTYVASKHAVTGLNRNAAIDYAPYGIRINSVNPAGTDTPLVERATAFVQAVLKAGHGTSMAGAKMQSILQGSDPQHRGATPWEQVTTFFIYYLRRLLTLLEAFMPRTAGGLPISLEG